jgi:glycosyltransferase involved in cell wall biosynthesis
MVPRKLKQIGADIFVSPDMMASLRTNCKQIVVLHDLNFEHYPQDLPAYIARYLRSQTPLFAQKADSIITVSQFSKTDIVKQYGVASSKVHVVYNAAQPSYRVLSDADRKEVRDEWTQGVPYFIFISSIHPRKNLQRLLLAYDQFRRESGQDVKLLAVGRRFWKNEILDSTLREMQFADDVIFTGHLEQEALCKALGAALSLVYVSYFEGFGVPIVEAFQSGVPVITSNVTSMPEVAGDAAILVNPFDANEIAEAMLSVFQDEEMRSDLIAKGLKRVTQFSWEQSAIDFWNVIEQTATK